MKVIELHKSVISVNDEEAKEVREQLKQKGVFLVNLMSSPGSGKTTLLKKLIQDMKEEYAIGVMEADIDSDIDAISIEKTGAKAIQVHTDGMCHMDAGMTKTSLEETDIDDLDLVFLENVGNLICPAEYDTGAVKKIMILSVPEGDDKPLKYPLMFKESDVLIISKIDALPYFAFDMDKCKERATYLNKNIQIFPVSAKTGRGMEKLENWLRQEVKGWKEG